MRRMVVETLVLALVLTGASIGQGQQQPGAPPKQSRIRVEEEDDVPKAKTAPTKSKLEDMLAEALRSNPDIRVAAAKVAEADAELNRTRLQVTQKIVALHAALATQKAEVVFRQTQYERFKQLAADKSIDARLMDEQQQRLTLAKAKLAELEAQMPALLGKAATPSLRLHSMAFSPDGQTLLTQSGETALYWHVASGKEIRLLIDGQSIQHRTGPLAERIRKALEMPVKADYKNVAFSELLEDLHKKAPGLSFHIRDLPWEIMPGTGRGEGVERKVTLHFDMPLPIAAILQAIEDQVGSHFFVRDYGILVSSVVQPPGAVTVQEFMRQKPAEKK